MENFIIYESFYHQNPNQKNYAYETPIENYRLSHEERILSIGFDAGRRHTIK